MMGLRGLAGMIAIAVLIVALAIYGAVKLIGG